MSQEINKELMWNNIMKLKWRYLLVTIIDSVTDNEINVEYGKRYHDKYKTTEDIFELLRYIKNDSIISHYMTDENCGITGFKLLRIGNGDEIIFKGILWNN